MISCKPYKTTIMKKYLFLLPLCLCVSFYLTSCSSDDDSGSDEEEEIIDDEGFQGTEEDIANFVTQDILDVITELGFVIHTGNNPPIISGVFEINPRVLENTNIPNDYAIGYEISPTEIYFENQNNSTLTFDYKEIEENISESLGDLSYVSGSGNDFSAFVRSTITAGEQSAISITAISGTVNSSGFTSTQQALFMLDNKGNPQDVFIENGQGRIFKDEDGSVDLLEERRPINLKNNLPGASQLFTPGKK